MSQKLLLRMYWKNKILCCRTHFIRRFFINFW